MQQNDAVVKNESAPRSEPPVDKLRWMYGCMSLIRQFEERVKWLVETGAPVGAVHYYIGQEAVAAGVCAALEPEDWIASTHRGHGHCIAKGAAVGPMMAELFGKATGTNRGKGGSMHITDITKGILGVNPIVGAGVAHLIGAGLSSKVRKTKQVAATFFGEGAAGIGTLHECINMAAIWKLPVVFVCENNGYAQATPFEYASSVPRVVDRAVPTACRVNSSMVRTWSPFGRRRSAQSRERVPATDHRSSSARRIATSAITKATTRSAIGSRTKRAAREKDCLRTFRARMQAAGPLALDELDAIDVKNKTLLDEAVEFAKASPLPEPDELLSNVYPDDGPARDDDSRA